MIKSPHYRGQKPESQASSERQVELPAGVPRPHATRDWGKWVAEELIDRGLTDVAHGTVFAPTLACHPVCSRCRMSDKGLRSGSVACEIRSP